MAETIQIIVNGAMPYKNKLQFIDLLFWKLIQYGAENRLQLNQNGLLPDESRNIFFDIHEKAKKSIENIRIPVETSTARMGRLREVDLLINRKSLESRGIVFFQELVDYEFRTSFIDDITSRDSLSLAGAGLALAAANFEPFRLTSIQTLSPLKANGVLTGIAAIIMGLAIAAHSVEQHPYDVKMDDVCVQIAEAYKNELVEKGFDKERAILLAHGLKECLNKPAPWSIPLSVSILTGNEEEK